jgi:FkbM family methyltransferase
MNKLLRKLLVATLPKGMTLRSKFDDGTIVCGRNAPGYGGRGVFIFGEDLEYELRLIPAIVRDGDHVMDVGANVGAFTMRMAKAAGDNGVVVAVEPFPPSAAMNLSNAIANGFRNIRLRVCCLSDKCGRQKFFMKRNKPNCFSLVDDGKSSSFDSPVVTIDYLVENEELPRVDFIKIDVEGVENEVIHGASETIRRFKPVMIVEKTLSGEIDVVEGYEALRYKDSHNVLLVPALSERMEELKALGFIVEKH